MSKKINKTISDIFKQFNNLKINYAVLRNFENLKQLRSDIDILYNGDIKNIKKILKKIAKINNWSYLIFDRNKSKNFSNISKIYIFYFFDLKKLNFIQIDFFNSLKIFTTPYYNFQISNKIKFTKDNIKTIPKNISYTYHIFQLASLDLKNKKNLKKIKKYRNRFLSINKKKIYLKKTFFEEFIINNIIIFLKQGNYANVKKIIILYKILILINYYIKNPFYFFYFFIRIYEFTLLYLFQPWTTSIKIKISNKIEKIKIFDFLNNLKKKNVIFDWKFSKNLNFFQKIFFSKKINLIVKTTNKKNNNENKIKLIFFKSFCANRDLIYSSKKKNENKK